MNTETILQLLLVSIGTVLGILAINLYRIKRHEDDILMDKTNRQVRLMARHTRLSALL